MSRVDTGSASAGRIRWLIDVGNRKHRLVVRYGIVLASILSVSLVGTPAVYGDVPTAADFAACNEEAPHAVKARAASPTTRDHVRADSARGGAVTPSSRHTGKAIESPDPQIHGMEAEGAKSAAYQAAYRTCMRRKGF
jgi:hypothetical protein